MVDALLDLLLRLSARERWLLGLLGMVVLPAALWTMLLQPLQARHDAARASRSEAQALGLWLVDRVGESTRMAPETTQSTHPPIGTSGLEQSLVDIGLRPQVSELSAQTGGTLRLRFDAVQFTQLSNWLSQSDPAWGYTIAAFRLERTGEPGEVAVDLTLDPQS